MRYRSLGLHVTDKCNMHCPHCIANASDAGSGVMSVEDIRRWVAAAKGYFENICITGGEALLFPDLVEQALACIRSNGFSSSLVSNCFWVRDPVRYESVLRLLNDGCLTKLAVSFDEFHDKRLFNESDLEKLLAEKTRRFSIVVQPCYLTRGDLQNRSDGIEELCRRYRCDFEPTVIVPFGRAEAIAVPSEEVFAADMPCDVVRMPMVRYDGVFTACCGPASGAPPFSPLICYNAVPAVFDAGKNDVIINALFLYGSRYLFDKLTDELKAAVSVGKHVDNACGLCRAMLDRREIVEYLYGVLEKEKWMILCSAEQDLQYGGDL